jgi:hypothetical protein
VEGSALNSAIERAIAEIGSLVEREMLRQRLPTASPHLVESGLSDRALGIALDDNRISHHQREMLESPENYLRPIRLIEQWRPPDSENLPKGTDRQTDRQLRSKPRHSESNPLTRVS